MRFFCGSKPILYLSLVTSSIILVIFSSLALVDVDQLVSKLNDKNPVIRKQAILELANQKEPDSKVINALIKALNDPV